MGAYGDWAQNYFDLGYSVVPIHPGKKGPYIKKWPEKFCENFPNEKEQDYYIKNFDECGIGLACGEASGIIAIDFDYVGYPDEKAISNLCKGVLPYTPCIKKGAKGWTAFYRWDGEVKSQNISRYSSNMVDVLAHGKQTVLPPSNHPTQGVVYRWISETDLLDSERDELPFIYQRHIDALKEVGEDPGTLLSECGAAKSSRHDLCVGFIIRFANQATDLSDLINNALEFDREQNGKDKKGPYFDDKSYLKGLTSYEFASKLCERVCDWKKRDKASKGIVWDIGKYPRLKAEGKRASTNYEDFVSFFRFNYPSTRYDILRRDAYYFDERVESWEPLLNIREVIESEASEAGLSPNYVNRHLQRWIQGLPPRLVVDIPRWDGKDHVSEMVSKLSVSNVPKSVLIDLFKDWAAGVFRRLYDTKGREQNRMIILKGGQGIGKDSFINHFFRGFGPYFSEIELTDRKIENFQTVSQLLVANIPEFDETHRVSLSVLKSIITSTGANYRAAYARKATAVKFAVSYISSCNFDNILRDSSGNRRFMIFEIEKIDWTYDKIDPVQIIAQMHHLYKIDYCASEESISAVDKYIKEATPEDTDDMILEDLHEVINDAEKTSIGNAVRWHDISQRCEIVSRRYRVSLKRVQMILGKKGYRKRDKNGNIYSLPNT